SSPMMQRGTSGTASVWHCGALQMGKASTPSTLGQGRTQASMTSAPPNCGGIITINHHQAALAGTIFHLASQADDDWRSNITTPEAPDWQKKELEKSTKALAEQERAEAEKRRIDELARKSRMEYDRTRKAAAAELKVRAETLDEEVRERREE